MMAREPYGSNGDKASDKAQCGGRLVWERPALRRLAVRSAEGGATSTISDSGNNNMS